MSLDTSITCFERELDFCQRKIYLNSSAKEFEKVFKNRNKKEALKFFSELPDCCRNYIMKRQPYKTYWRASRIQV